METRKGLGPAPGWSEGRGFWQRSSCNQRMGALVVLWNTGAVPSVGCLIFLFNIPLIDPQGGTALQEWRRMDSKPSFETREQPGF